MEPITEHAFFVAEPSDAGSGPTKPRGWPACDVRFDPRQQPVTSRAPKSLMVLILKAIVKLWWHCLIHFHCEARTTGGDGRTLALYCVDCDYTAYMTPENIMRIRRGSGSLGRRRL